MIKDYRHIGGRTYSTSGPGGGAPPAMTYYSWDGVPKETRGDKFFELSNHLGNVLAVVTDRKLPVDDGLGAIAYYQPDVVSYSDYYPFGMPMPGRNANSGDCRYGWNTQESVDEISGVKNHYTAPYWEYDPRVVMRWNTDPKPNPSISPYAIVQGNPIWYSDPLGDTVKVSFRSGFLGLGKKQTLNYEGGSLFNADGSAYAGKTRGFLKQSLNALNDIRSTREGGTMLEELESSENVFTLEHSKNNPSGNRNEFVASDRFKAHGNQYATDPDGAAAYSHYQSIGTDFTGGSGGTIYWNPGGGTSVPEQGGNFANRPSVFLGHEMFHSLDANRGLFDSRTHLGISRNEWQAVYRENVLRQQMGLPLRTHYKSSYNPSTGERKGLPPYMLTSGSSPILPSWYKP
ncbi:hypothetical protein GCM10009118_07410 [Wandonia haliotis]|uniref:RHS repeat-associated core domain-containing protein n=2 Tax=Wandonia haliotis TaxID=574963 RepID=A0ABN1MN31_9FLAO